MGVLRVEPGWPGAPYRAQLVQLDWRFRKGVGVGWRGLLEVAFE